MADDLDALGPASASDDWVTVPRRRVPWRLGLVVAVVATGLLLVVMAVQVLGFALTSNIGEFGRSAALRQMVKLVVVMGLGWLVLLGVTYLLLGRRNARANLRNERDKSTQFAQVLVVLVSMFVLTPAFFFAMGQVSVNLHLP